MRIANPDDIDQQGCGQHRAATAKHRQKKSDQGAASDGQTIAFG
jgi:hypothetical protein